ncbi:peptidoglycan-binding protein [Planktothrix sp. FACHB-1355]|uniref:Peptidoglycan-binding protein n=1 Tax=Aerosakkonema funiforme FACHB-1375 TaxID=2949571 RepID=A0A926VDY0_9CYAN|nr:MULTISPECIES: peptidoglycan-binding protein [Oscillatoriales]MBD2182171.1 peptidoglycan-binding protein [Aerosakkonema funiforme FACHB-1375]MBD3561527.1 peptidoglycan-binding protein [Planktothrix sp. FACHB-1355]
MNTKLELVNTINDAALAGPVLYPWDSGPAVAQLQEFLCAHGFMMRVDGDYGSVTEAAVKTFQRQQGLRANGIVDAKTWAALKGTVLPGTRILKLGHSGGDVRELQGLLQVHGYNVIRNGIFNSDTKLAVIAFQQKHKLKANGMVDRITWTILRGGSPLPPLPEQGRWYINFRKWW